MARKFASQTAARAASRKTIAQLSFTGDRRGAVTGGPMGGPMGALTASIMSTLILSGAFALLLTALPHPDF